MKFSEFSEGQKTGAQTVARRMTAPNVSTVDRSAPWVKSAIGKSRKRTKDFSELQTDKEKFDFLYNLTSGKTNNKIRIAGDTFSDYHVQAYNPTTGDITLAKPTRESNNTFTGNVNNFKYHGRTSSSLGKVKTYTFTTGDLDLVSSEPKTPKALGRPKPKVYQFPKMPW